MVSMEGGGEFSYLKNKFKNMRRLGCTALGSERIAIFRQSHGPNVWSGQAQAAAWAFKLQRDPPEPGRVQQV